MTLYTYTMLLPLSPPSMQLKNPYLNMLSWYDIRTSVSFEVDHGTGHHFANTSSFKAKFPSALLWKCDFLDWIFWISWLWSAEVSNNALSVVQIMISQLFRHFKTPPFLTLPDIYNVVSHFNYPPHPTFHQGWYHIWTTTPSFPLPHNF